MNEEYELILQCYRSGQMSEAQWQKHLDDKDFKSWHYLNVVSFGSPDSHTVKEQDELKSIYAAARSAGWCFVRHADGIVRMEKMNTWTAQSADGQAQQVANADPVYQASYRGGYWQDCSRERYEYLHSPECSAPDDWKLRELFTAPVTAQPDPAMSIGISTKNMPAHIVQSIDEATDELAQDLDFLRGLTGHRNALIQGLAKALVSRHTDPAMAGDDLSDDVVLRCIRNSFDEAGRESINGENLIEVLSNSAWLIQARALLNIKRVQPASKEDAK